MTTLRCSSCRQEKAEDAFAKNRSRSTGRQNQCRECFNAMTRRRHAERKEREAGYVERQRERMRARHVENVRRSSLLKLARGCEQCGARPEDPAQLHWDHLDPKDKWSALGEYAEGTNKSAFIRGWAWSRIEAELAKCRVLCRSCHARHTAWQVKHGLVGKVA